MRKETVLNYKMTFSDANNLGEIVHPGRQLDIWGDAETELMILNDGDESLCVGYKNVKFYHDLYVGDQVDFKATLVKVGNSSRTCKLETYKVATPARKNGNSYAQANDVEILDPPLLCGEGFSTLVVKEELQRGMQPDGLIDNPWE
ncbi:beta-alanyl-CoA:ammonia lyase [Clostridium rectalis]|uniref:beta-alanyl-CoA:ammonia lyase n=1 Tax=Clostridium rectalis TaxID=2040295 RepID=UPI000F62CA81|nr:beta-alanyl-CoA:ammonia lyase [Clostridium rectalis]